MKRLLALVVAIGLVAAAVVIRRAIDDEPANADGPGTADQPSKPGSGRVVCASDLGRICDAVGGAVKEPPAVTTAAIQAGTFDADTWITAAPWADLANARTNTFGKLPKPIASSPLQFYVVNTRAAEVPQACGSELSWACIASATSRNFFAYDNPTTTTAGLLSLVQLAAAKLNTTDFGTNDFTQFDTDVAKIKRAQILSTAADSVLVENEGNSFAGAAAVTAIEAVALTQTEALRLRGRYQVAAAKPLVAADLVVVTRSGVKAAISNDRVKSEALKLGWKNEVPGAEPLPAADVLEQLQLLWTRLT